MADDSSQQSLQQQSDGIATATATQAQQYSLPQSYSYLPATSAQLTHQLGNPYSSSSSASIQQHHPMLGGTLQQQQPLRFGLFPQNHQTFPVAVSSSSTVSASSTAASSQPMHSAYSHPIYFDRGTGSLQAGHPAYGNASITHNPGPTIYSAPAHHLLGVGRLRSGTPLTNLGTAAAAVAAFDRDASGDEDDQAPHQSESNSAANQAAATIAAAKEKKRQAALAQQQQQVKREDRSAAPAEQGRETYGIVDEETTSLWDLADGPDGYNGKPPYPYLTLIRIALLSSEHKRLTLQELYDALEARYPFFDGEAKGWKNSIRHNLSLNKCFKKEARHVLDPGKGSYWYVDLSEEYSTPRVRIREPKKKARDEDDDSASPPPVASKGKKRKTSPNAAFIPPAAKAARPADLKLPPANPAIMQRGRPRAISAPSPSTASFFTAANVQHGGYALAGSYGAYQAGPYGTPLFFQPGYPSFLPVGGFAAMSSTQTIGDTNSLGQVGLGQEAPEEQQPLHPYREEVIDVDANAEVDADADHSMEARPGSAQSNVADGRPATAEPVVKEEPLEVDIPAMVPDSGIMPDTGSTITTPRSIFSKMLEKSTAAAALANVAAAASVGGPLTSLSSPPPGPVASYSFPHSMPPATAPAGTRITIAPTVTANGAFRPAPLSFLNKDLRRAYSPPVSSAMAQSPTRLLPSKDYDTLFSSMPFGMMFGDGTGKRPSRSGSIFGLSARS